MTLQNKSLTELRGIAQAMGIDMTWDADRNKLIQDISTHIVDKVQAPEKPIQVNFTNPNDQGGYLRQDDIEKALEGFKPLGLTVDFPDAGTWHMYCNERHDSGTMAMSMWSLVQCAKAMVSK